MDSNEMNSRFKKLSVAFLWHMHQPCYKDTVTGKYLLPWVRLHAVKDYFPMAALLEGFDNVRAVFNLVPSLLEQINDYALNDATDVFLDLAAKKASSLSLDDKLDILENFFRVNFKYLIEPNERYSQLLIKKGVNNTSDRSLMKAANDYSTQDMLDLQVLFNLVWFHSLSIDEDINLKDLIRKGSSYTEEDKEYVLLKQKEIMSQVIPLYRKLQDAGRIEISATPFYHPITPLLCDTSIARISTPKIDLPLKRFSHPEDARWHIEEAIKYHTLTFGSPPRGMWPSEGSVSDEALEIMASNGIKWAATDEDILFNSIAMRPSGPGSKRAAPLDRRILYEPYKFKIGSKSLSVIFRDKNLSDMISFNYNSWEQRAAADDLMTRLKKIAAAPRLGKDRPIVTIAMDGENAWEYFGDNGRTFFETLYEHLDDDDELEAVTISDHLHLGPARKTLDTIFPASWINHNFNIWIGEEQDNVSWNYLWMVRRDLVKFTKELEKSGRQDEEALRKAWREFYIAEGSDWNWWYSGKAHMGVDNPFDELYRKHLKNVYKYLKKEIPDFLKISIA
ncbi:MAG: glycoside hydrolase family 57 protein [Candidatus Omnitrophota bacterium]|nr:glycoside hydrolase family 57 protein [Candidatus Omnitrophota bacterium]